MCQSWYKPTLKTVDVYLPTYQRHVNSNWWWESLINMGTMVGWEALAETPVKITHEFVFCHREGSCDTFILDKFTFVSPLTIISCLITCCNHQPVILFSFLTFPTVWWSRFVCWACMSTVLMMWRSNMLVSGPHRGSQVGLLNLLANLPSPHFHFLLKVPVESWHNLVTFGSEECAEAKAILSVAKPKSSIPLATFGNHSNFQSIGLSLKNAGNK